MAAISRTFSIRTLLIVTAITAIAATWISQERPKEREIDFGRRKVTRQFENAVYEIEFDAFGCLVSTTTEHKALEETLKTNPQLFQKIAEKAASNIDEHTLGKNQLGLLQRELLIEARKSLGPSTPSLKSVGFASYDCCKVSE